MLINAKTNERVIVEPAYKFEVGYDAKHNEFSGQSHKAVNRYAAARRGLREVYVPASYPKDGMFSIQARAKLV